MNQYCFPNNVLVNLCHMPFQVELVATYVTTFLALKYPWLFTWSRNLGLRSSFPLLVLLLLMSTKICLVVRLEHALFIVKFTLFRIIHYTSTIFFLVFTFVIFIIDLGSIGDSAAHPRSLYISIQDPFFN